MGNPDDHIEALLQEFTEIRIYQCYREANQAADFLATTNCNLSNIMSSQNYSEFHVII